MSAPCYGQTELFESTDETMHRIAKKVCETCPIELFAACRKLRDDTIAEYGVGEHGVQGTWAGDLFVGARKARNRDIARMAEEDARFTDREAAAARSAYVRGDRSEETLAGVRVYNRRWTQRRADRTPLDAEVARIQAEDAAYTEDESRRAATAYRNGDRTDWARIGKRVYYRNLRRKAGLQGAA